MFSKGVPERTVTLSSECVAKVRNPKFTVMNYRLSPYIQLPFERPLPPGFRDDVISKHAFLCIQSNFTIQCSYLTLLTNYFTILQGRMPRRAKINGNSAALA